MPDPPMPRDYWGGWPSDKLPPNYLLEQLAQRHAEHEKRTGDLETRMNRIDRQLDGLASQGATNNKILWTLLTMMGAFLLGILADYFQLLK